MTHSNNKERKNSVFPLITVGWIKLEKEVVQAFCVGRFNALVTKTRELIVFCANHTSLQ